MRKVETAFGAVIASAGVILLTLAVVFAVRELRPSNPQPSGVWAGLVDELPSGRTVECVFARDPSGSVALTCDWANAVRTRP